MMAWAVALLNFPNHYAVIKIKLLADTFSSSFLGELLLFVISVLSDAFACNRALNAAQWIVDLPSDQNMALVRLYSLL